MQSTKTQVSRRLTILCTEEIDSLFSMPHFTEGERQIHFELSPEERPTIDAARTITAGVHLVLQLGYFKAKAQFFVVSLDHVRPDINHILTRYYPGRLMSEDWQDTIFQIAIGLSFLHLILESDTGDLPTMPADGKII